MHVILAMIVKDEEQVIGRCLDSALEAGLVDGWVIIDTGSTDRTKQIITEKLAGIDGELLDREWVSFGHNRNELLAAVNERYMLGMVLLLDADMTIEGTWPVPEIGERQPGYLVKSIEGQMEHYVCRIVEVGQPWRYVGSTHEVITHPSYHPTQKASLVITHHADGGSRAEKFERDARLLEKDHFEDPHNARTVFYLANTYRDLGQEAAAIRMYIKRIEMGGWAEEVYYAMWQRARLIQDPSALLQAWEHSPWRGEALHEAMNLFNAHRCYRTVISLHEQWLQECYRQDSILFTEPWRETWGIPTEYGCALWHLGRVEEARETFGGLLMLDLDDWQRANTRSNLELSRGST